MANVNWSWHPPKGYKAPKNLGDVAIPGPKGNARTNVPYTAPKTERVEAGGHARGPGNNVSDVMRGVNNAHDKALGMLGRNALARNPKRMKERARRKLERKAYMCGR